MLKICMLFDGLSWHNGLSLSHGNARHDSGHDAMGWSLLFICHVHSSAVAIIQASDWLLHSSLILMIFNVITDYVCNPIAYAVNNVMEVWNTGNFPVSICWGTFAERQTTCIPMHWQWLNNIESLAIFDSTDMFPGIGGLLWQAQSCHSRGTARRHWDIHKAARFCGKVYITW